MTDKPIPTGEACTAPHPSAEAVEYMAAHWYDGMWADVPGSSTWDTLPAKDQHEYRQSALSLILPAYPQIIADILRHYSAVARDATWTDTAWWLDYRAAEIPL